MTRQRLPQLLTKPLGVFMAIIAGSGVTLLLGGCQTTLEDGYKPHGLDATPDMRRSYYASPFTDQANGGGSDHDSGLRIGH